MGYMANFSKRDKLEGIQNENIESTQANDI